MYQRVIINILLVGLPLCGILAVIFGAVALSRHGKDHPLLQGGRRRFAEIALGILGCICICLFNCGLVILSDRIHEPYDQMTQCRENLVNLSVAMKAYAFDNDDCLPTAENWLDLLKGYSPKKDNVVHTCPLGGEYRVFLNDCKLTDIENMTETILAVCPNTHVVGKTPVLFADGRVYHCNSILVERAIRSTPFGKMPVLANREELSRKE